MSLIEQASKRLEELRRTGSEVAGELSELANRETNTLGASEPSTIEQAVSYARIRKARQAAPYASNQVASLVGEAVHVSPRDRGIAGGSEPRLDELGEPRAAGASKYSRTDARRRVDLDMSMLASRGYLTPDHPESGLANQFRKVKWPLVQACQGKTQPRVGNANRIMITSSVPGEGKSFVSLNLAFSIAAERGHSVLLIDADTTRPSLSRLLGISSEPGLLDLLFDKETHIEEALHQTNVERLLLLGAGSRRPHATELLASEAMERLVQQLAGEYPDRILIFDAPPLLAAPEPAVLATYMGQIVVVAEADRTTHATLRSALATIESCPVVRMVLNKTSRSEAYSYAG